MRNSFIIVFSVFSLTVFANKISDTILIRGVGSYYKNCQIELYQIDDYITQKEVKLNQTMVDSLGYFEFRLRNIPTQKLVLRSRNNSGFLYVQPGGNYLITFPEKNEYDEKRLNGNHVDLIFYRLDSADINYKILNFDRWIEKEMGEFYHLKKIKQAEYEKGYTELKLRSDQIAKKDTNLFFIYHIKYTLAEMDDLETVTSNMRIQNYAKWFHKLPIYYRNGTYMNYFNIFYENLIVYTANSAKDAMYDAVIHRSPSLAMKALGEVDELKNMQIRELALLKFMMEQCYEKRYPKTNLIFMLDSIKMRSKFPEHRKVAANIIERVTDLVVGSHFIDFNLKSTNNDTLTNALLEGKHIYFHYFSPSDENCLKEIQPLIKLYQTYGDYIQFVTIKVNNDHSEFKNTVKLPWKVIELDEDDEFIKNSKVKIFPTYILLDQLGNIVANPALRPIPNSDYQTIEPLFFQIKRAITGERRRK